MANPYETLNDAELAAMLNQQQLGIAIPGNPANTISVRQNNPGNIKYAGLPGQLGAGTRDFAIYESPEAGFDGIQDLVERYKSKGTHTLSSFAHKYAPSFENDTNNWINVVGKFTGAGPDTPLDNIPTYDLARGIAFIESSTKIPGQGGLVPTSNKNPFQGLSDDELAAQLNQNTPKPQAKPQPNKVKSIPELVAGAVAPGAPSTPPEMFDPTSESLNMFRTPEFLIPEPETIVGMAAGAKGPVGITAPVTGMALAATGGIKRALQGKQETYRPSDYALMEQGLPAVSNEMMQDMGIGAGFDILGRGAAKIAGKLFSPVWEKAQQIGDVLNWAKERKIPIPADVTKTFIGKAAENIPDIGVGGYLVQMRRQKTAEGLTNAVRQLADDAGIPSKPAFDVGQDLADILKGLVSGTGEYTKLQTVLKSMPQDRTIPLLSLKESVMSIGSGKIRKLKGGEKLLEGKTEAEIIAKGIERIENVYGRNAQPFVNTIKELAENGWVATPSNVSTLDKLINRGISKKGWEGATSQVQSMADRLKGNTDKWKGLHDDLFNFTTGEGENLGKLVIGKNEAYKDAIGFINQINPELKLLYQRSGSLRPGQSRWEVTMQAPNLETAVDKIFAPQNIKNAEIIKNKLIELGREDVWDTAKMAYLEKAFSKATFKKGDDLFFDPTKFKEWFKTNDDYLKTVMPETYPAIAQWSKVSDVFEADMKRFKSSQVRSGLGWAVGGLGGATSILTGGAGGVAIPQAFSLLSALSVMPYTGFVRKWLTTQTPSVAGPMIGQAVKGAGIEYKKRD